MDNWPKVKLNNAYLKLVSCQRTFQELITRNLYKSLWSLDSSNVLFNNFIFIISLELILLNYSLKSSWMNILPFKINKNSYKIKISCHISWFQWQYAQLFPWICEVCTFFTVNLKYSNCVLLTRLFDSRIVSAVSSFSHKTLSPFISIHLFSSM